MTSQSPGVNTAAALFAPGAGAGGGAAPAAQQQSQQQAQQQDAALVAQQQQWANGNGGGAGAFDPAAAAFAQQVCHPSPISVVKKGPQSSYNCFLDAPARTATAAAQPSYAAAATTTANAAGMPQTPTNRSVDFMQASFFPEPHAEHDAAGHAAAGRGGRDARQPPGGGLQPPIAAQLRRGPHHRARTAGLRAPPTGGRKVD